MDMLVSLIFASSLMSISQEQEPPSPRTPAIYRCPATDADGKFFAPFVHDYGFDRYCVEPKPSAKAATLVKDMKLKFVDASMIDTKANLAWRNATIDFVNGKISPKAWLEKTKNLKETVHFLSSPKTAKLRPATGNISYRATLAELFTLSLPGLPCFTADDLGSTRYLPEPGPVQSWYLAMNDWLGPMLYMRSEDPFLVTGKPKILRADAKPGLFIFSQTNGKKTFTFYMNNAKTKVELPAVNFDHVTINKGIDMDGPKPALAQTGFMIVMEEKA